MPITYYELYQKFRDKGYDYEFTLLVVPPPIIFPISAYLYFTEQEQKEVRRKSIKETYSREWDYWSTWIDRQQYKF